MEVPNLVKDLQPDVLKELSLLLNPDMVVSKDWRSLASKFNMKYQHILNYERKSDPTAAVLKDWWSGPGDKTVTVLISMLRSMKRIDAVNLLKPHEFTDYSEEEDSTQEPAENNDDETLSNLVVRLSELPENGHDNEGDNGSTDVSRRPGKAKPSEHTSCDRTYVVDSSSLASLSEESETESNDGVNENSNSTGNSTGVAERGSENSRNKGLIAASVQTQIPSPNVGMDAPSFPSPDSRNKGLIAASVQTQIPSPTVGMDAPSFPSPVIESCTTPQAPLIVIESHTTLQAPLIAPHDKIALVIGNQNYQRRGYRNLSCTLNDAFDIAVALKRLGFKVLSLMDLTLTEMRTAMLAFCRLLGRGIFAVFYFAGHGYEMEGENYLLPVDAKCHNPNQSIRAQEFLQEMQSCGALLNLMFLDCCRSKTTDYESPKCHLKRTTTGNTIIAYSCLTQHRAFEEPQQKNGVYARHLLKNIYRDVRIEIILMDVNTAVMKSLSVDQRPTFESDAYYDCRLTAPTTPEPDTNIVRERLELWEQGSVFPMPRDITFDEYDITLRFTPGFSNIMMVDVSARNTSNELLENLKFKIESYSPLLIEQESRTINLRPAEVAELGEFKIYNLQKLCNESVFIVMEFVTKDASQLRKMDMGTPLIAGITSKFHEWIKDRRYKTPSGATASWI